MVKGDATKYRKSIGGRMNDKQKKHYAMLLTRETKGYAEAKAKLEARKKRGDFKRPSIRVEDTDTNTYEVYSGVKHRAEVEAKKKPAPRRLRGADQNPTTHYGKEIRRPKFVPEVRSVDLGVSMAKPKGKPVDIDPRKIDVKKDAKKFGKFKPELIHRISDTGLADLERSQAPQDSGYFAPQLVQYPTTTTGGEAVFQDIDGSGILRHPAMRGDKPVFGGVGVATPLNYAPFDKPKDGREFSGIRNYALDEESIVGQTIDRGNLPMSKPRSWEGTKGGGYSRKEAYKAGAPMSLERRLKKGAIGTIGKADEELRKSQAHPQQKPFKEPKAREFPNVPILKTAEYVAGKLGYKKDPEHAKLADLRIKQGAFSRGECGDSVGDQTCSEFYLLNQRPTEISRETLSNYEGRRGKTPIENFYNKAGSRSVAKPSELDYKMERRGETITHKPPTNIELDIVRRYGGKGGRTLGTNELAVKEGMSYDYDKSRPRHRKEQPAGMKPVKDLSVKDLRRLAVGKGIPTTSREEKSKEYEPAKLSKKQVQKKMVRGLPVDMSYNYYGEAGTAGEGMSGFLEEAPSSAVFSSSGELLEQKEIIHKSDAIDGDISDGDEDFDEENPMGDMDAYRY